MSFPIGTIQRSNQLSHNTGVITVTNLLAKIGGQNKFAASVSRTIATDVVLAANTRYQVFAVLVGGAVQLRISINENSVGPVGFTAWALVGAFYSNALTSVSFGSFVTIEGIPRTGPMEVTLTSPNASWIVASTAGKNQYFRDGKYMDFSFRMNLSSPQALLAQIALPANLTGEAFYSTSGGEANPVGTLGTAFLGELAFMSMKPNSAFFTVNLFRLATYGSGISQNANALGGGDVVATGRVAVNEWNNTPLKDL